MTRSNTSVHGASPQQSRNPGGQDQPVEMANPVSFGHRGEDPDEVRSNDLGAADAERQNPGGQLSLHSSCHSQESQPPATYHQAQDPDLLQTLSHPETQRPPWYRNLSTHRPTTRTPNQQAWRDFRLAFLLFKPRRGDNTPVSPAKAPNQQALNAKTRERASEFISAMAGIVPGVLIVALSFLTDEHGTRRAPMLLYLLGYTITDITGARKTRNRRYRIDLEYGLGPERLQWTIYRLLKDLAGLHARLRVMFFRESAVQLRLHRPADMPKFPRWGDASHLSEHGEPSAHASGVDVSAAIPEVDSVLESQLQSQSQPQPQPQSQPQSQAHLEHLSLPATSSNGRHRFHRSQLSISSFSRLLAGNDERDERHAAQAEHLRRALQEYLKQLTAWLLMRPQLNRVFEFLELLPMQVLLAGDGGYQGSQGYLWLRLLAKAQGWRVGHLRASDLKAMVLRHTTKWVLVRHLYIMYVGDLNLTTPLEVFLVDSKFKLSYSGDDDDGEAGDDHGNAQHNSDNESEYDESVLDVENTALNKKGKTPHFRIDLENGERQLRFLAATKAQLQRWVRLIQTMQLRTLWLQPNRFELFAPVRKGCYAQWMVDGRDHMWAILLALEMARDVIYIHDWWLLPELYLRRPAAGNQRWRLDRVLKRKAEQGVKIFVVVYRNVGNTVATDSLYTKHLLLDLHQNVHVIRLPNQWLQNTYFWAHHEKLCIVDHTIAFVGGIDLCYGRWDTADHVLDDSAPQAFPGGRGNKGPFRTFVGKDYSNPRVMDFVELDKPYEEMYDREYVPRMPWHDVHMVTAGHPARDLARHFVQRWNYLLRQKRPLRPTPLLLPPPEFTDEELCQLDLKGTCEVQMLRLLCNWLLGLQQHEQSIQNAYLRLIETLEHFVYIENQFFITSCSFEGVVVKNRIGDALVERIIRAHQAKKPWRACIVIPLMPGFPLQVDEPDGGLVRLIMECQYMLILQGPTSIFGKLRLVGIQPEEYIQFFLLRKWSKIGRAKMVVLEQLYIHAKTMVVDDRVAIIGSANINERLMRGVRDLEVACVVRDLEVVHTKMNGQPYAAGKFAHTLRMRLMREHMGVNVDVLEVVERRFNRFEEQAKQRCGEWATVAGDGPQAVLSAMVELASREVLQVKATERWVRFHKRDGQAGEANGGQAANGGHHHLKPSPMDENTPGSPHTPSSPRSPTDDVPPHLTETAPPVPLAPVLFNHRAGEENAGIRDKKLYSQDPRVQNNTKHKEDVSGDGVDQYHTKGYRRQARRAAQVMNEWAKRFVSENPPSAQFLPQLEHVMEYLGDEEGDRAVDDGGEPLIALDELNAERWTLLKRVAYLQRAAGVAQAQARDLAAVPSTARSLDLGAALRTVTARVDVRKAKAAPVAFHTPGDGTEPTPEPADEPRALEDDVPIVHLPDSAVAELVKEFGPRDGLPVGYVDPYGFEDPLLPHFYEGVWYETAWRNTMLFRTVFHCQPDDEVLTWRDYKEYCRRGDAFIRGQRQEMRPHLELDTELVVGSVRVTEEAMLPGVLGRHDTRESIAAQGVPMKRNTLDAAASAQYLSALQHEAPRRLFTRRHGRNRNDTYDGDTGERILHSVQGHIVLFPSQWLSTELQNGNWLYPSDRLPPIEIYD